MPQLIYREWVFDCDVEVTKKVYESISTGWVETCECAGCRNFLAQRENVFPKEILKLFADLGVNYKRDAEIYYITQMRPGTHLYGGWFHFVGKILKRAIGPAILGPFTVDFIHQNAPANEGFKNYLLVQIEITAEIGWVIDDDEFV